MPTSTMIRHIGALTHRQEKAIPLAKSIELAFASLHKPPTAIRTAYLIWKEPYMSIGADTFIHDMLTRAGYTNIFGNQTRYPITSLAEIQSLAPALLLLSSEPYPFKQKHIDALQPLLPDTKILLVDGEMFSWYGSRLLQSPTYFRSLKKSIDAVQ